ncbi:MAG: hypothetical protein DRJ08_01385 [Acidobacteria bacterium]|nr:MAG: hypothetical protein DRJ08_01385 [Acidobacteriota bacterium]
MKKNAFFLAVLLITIPSCRHKPDDMPFRIVLSKYFTAVQKDDVKTMASCLTLFDEIKGRYGETGGAVLEFKQKVKDISTKYKQELQDGMLHFDPYGIEATRIMGLGKGFYYETVGLEVKKDSATITLAHSFRYDKLDYDVFPVGTTLFFLSCPIGKILKVKTGEYQKGLRMLLQKIQTRWYFKKDLQGKWKISRMEILPDTAHCIQSHRPRY